MKICVERDDWTQTNPDLVVFVGDSYADFTGPVPDSLSESLKTYSEGFTAGTLRREIQFAGDWGDENSFQCVYFHTSTEKGFTSTETLKTFVTRALHLAADTGRKKVAFILKGPAGEGLTDQVVEGALVGTHSFKDYKKDNTDHFADVELMLCLPSPQAEVPAEGDESSPSDQGAIEATEVLAAEESTEDASDDTEISEEAEVKAEDAEPDAKSEDEEAEKNTDDADQAKEEQPDADNDEDGSLAGTSEAPEISAEVWASLKAADDSALAVGYAFGEGVNLARSLVARPAADCTPDYLSRTAKKLASTHGFSYQSFGPKLLDKHGYAGLVTVGKGADNSPRMIELAYKPEQESDVHLVLLGKGVTFDSGGISIKGANKMHLMIGDMAGAAAVLGAMEVLGRLRPNIRVTGLVVSAENKPGSKSYRPGDIIKYKNGTSVHVENTDAEGRLILADGLIRAGELEATHIVDLATLTGAASRALGPSFTGVMGANRKLVNAITRAGGNHGESYWRLPMPLEYKSMLKSLHADINNMGGPAAGATTAALFLKEFVPERTPWVHLDIAGTFWKQKPWKYYAEGPSGTGVKTIADLALRWSEHLA